MDSLKIAISNGGTGGFDSTYNYNVSSTIRPAVVLNAKTLIDTTDSTRDGKSAATAWNFKY